MDSDFKVGEIVILNELACKGLPSRVGERCIIAEQMKSVNYDFKVSFDDGEIAPVKYDEINKLTDRDKKYMEFIFIGNKVEYHDQEVVIVIVDYLLHKAEIKVGEVEQVVDFKELQPIKYVDILEEIINYDTRPDKHRKVIEEIHTTFNIKNADYGNSFGEQFAEYGILSAIIRLDDKMRRLKQLMKQPAQVKDESIQDTLLDLANYSIMTIMELRKNEENE